MSDFSGRMKEGFLVGAKKGWHTFIWISKIVIPVSLLITLLQWTGWLNYLDFALNPLMSLLNLPPQAALPIITGMLVNLYPVVAMITVIPFTIEQMTLIAVFNLIAHNLIMEGIVQHKSGYNALKATLIRIAAATVTVLIISQFMGDTSQAVVIPASLSPSTPVLEVLKNWVVDTFLLLLRIFGIIMAIMILQEYFTSLGWIERIQSLFRPVMKIMGLSPKTTMTWLTANIFGLFYGGAVIVEEAGKGAINKEDLDHLQTSIGINHSMVEDPALFAVLGLPPFWLWIPRLIMVIIVAQGYRLVTAAVNGLRRRAPSKA